MLQKIKILDRLINGANRFFKSTLLSRQVQNLVQFHSGGDDYNPPDYVEGLGDSIGNNPANSIVFAWRDLISRKSQPGEKRIYSVSMEEPDKVAAEIYLKNDGIIEISGNSDLKVVILGNVDLITTGDANISAANVNVSAGVTNLGEGGAKIARLGDEVEVEITSGSSAGTYKGKITSSGVNTSI